MSSNKYQNMPLEDYEILAKIGSGKYSSVYRARRTQDQRLFAVKRVAIDKMERRARANALSEANLLSGIHHPNVIAMEEAFYDSSAGCLCLVLELAEVGDLSSLLRERGREGKTFSEDQIWEMVRQLGLGLQYLHANGVLHRDIKTSNVLLHTDGTLKIADFNVSKQAQGLSLTRTGTLAYASPQVWRGEPYDNKTDIWSLGCLVYELLQMHPPFQGEDCQQVYRCIAKGQYERIKDQYSREIRDLVSFMLQLNPKLRPSAQTVHKMALAQVRRAIKPPSRNKLTPLVLTPLPVRPIQKNLLFQIQSTINVEIDPNLRPCKPQKIDNPKIQLKKPSFPVNRSIKFHTNRLHRTRSEVPEPQKSPQSRNSPENRSPERMPSRRKRRYTEI